MSTPDIPPRRLYLEGFGRAQVEFSRYTNGWLAVELRDAVTGDPIARLSVVPEDAPEPAKGQFWAKLWSENLLILDDVLASGHFRPVQPPRMWPCGFVAAQLWEIVPRPEAPHDH